MIGELECPHWKAGSKNHPLSSAPRSTFHSCLPLTSHAISSPTEPNTATTCWPSVAGDELAWLLLVWRLTLGAPVNAVRSHRIFPVALSTLYTLKSWTDRSSTGFTSP